MLHSSRKGRRRGIILLVVLAMLTLLTILGISFVMAADSSQTASRIYCEAGVRSGSAGSSSNGTNLKDYVARDATAAWDNFLGQLIYDVNDDADGANSSLRGHSLARLMYGYNAPTAATPNPLNDRPWTGTGRLSETINVGGSNADSRDLVNYKYFSADGFVRDPGRLGVRLDPTAAQSPVTGDLNVGYTYPDRNNMFLAMQDPLTGRILMPSYHREYLMGAGGFLGNAANGYWTDATGKYRTLRPRPFDNTATFPMPADQWGDIKNLDNMPGGNDSILVDFGAPVRDTGDGRKYKCLVAPLVLEMDGRINLQTAGNISGPGLNHASNQGWGAWEVSLRLILDADATEWKMLFTGTPSASPPIYGKYAVGNPATASPRPLGTPVLGGTVVGPRYPIDFNGVVDPAADGGAALSGQFRFPGQGTPALAGYRMYPDYPTNAYGNAVPVETTTTGTGAGAPNHPSIYNVFRPFRTIGQPENSNRNFPPTDLAAMLRLQNKNGDGLPSDVLKLLKNNLLTDTNGGYRRRLLTTMSVDIDRPSAVPQNWDVTAAGATYTFKQPGADPNGWYASATAQQFQGRTGSPPASSDYDPATWKARLPAFKIDLKRSLANYPAPDGSAHKFDLNDANVTAQLQKAILERQALAKELFDRLVLVTGARPPATITDTTSAEFNAVRWLAQHAVNIVDYIDNDEYSTPFQFRPGHWVYGVEAPRLVINEYYAQWDNIRAQLTDSTGMGNWQQGGGNYQVNVWVELHNPAGADAAHPEGGSARLHNGTDAVYRLRLAQKPSQNLRRVDNSLGQFNLSGTPDDSTIQSTVVTNWGTTDATRTVQPGQANFQGTDTKNEGFYVVGPKPDYEDAGGTQPSLAATNPNLAARATWTAPELSYSVPTAVNLSNDADKPALYLERLANPYLPPSTDTTSIYYNPYITVDYVERVEVEDGRLYSPTGMATPNAINVRQARGKGHPLAGAMTMWKPQSPAGALPMNQPKNSMFRHNSESQTPPANASDAGATLQYPFDTFVHLDRVPTSPFGLLHVSGVRPHELTQTFLLGTGTALTQRFQHRARWAQPDTRLYRLLEHVTVGPWAGGVDVNGRIPGRVNVNALWDVNVFRALCDRQAANQFTGGAGGEVDQVYNQLFASRTPDVDAVTTRPYPGPNSRPYYPLGAADGQYGDALGATPANTAGNRGLGQTLLRPLLSAGALPASTSDASQQRMLEPTGGFDVATYAPPTGQPLRRFELMEKIGSQLTTRSNVFAVWATICFFEVDPATNKLKGEMDWGTGVIRHRMFAIIDRTQIQTWPTYSDYGTPTCRLDRVITPSTLNASTLTLNPQSFSLLDAGGNPISATNGITNPNTGRVWVPQVGALLTFIDDNGDEETVEVTAVSGATIQAAFRKAHDPTLKPVVVINRGNPGPWKLYDPKKDLAVVPYYTVFE